MPLPGRGEGHPWPVGAEFTFPRPFSEWPAILDPALRLCPFVAA